MRPSIASPDPFSRGPKNILANAMSIGSRGDIDHEEGSESNQIMSLSSLSSTSSSNNSKLASQYAKSHLF